MDAVLFPWPHKTRNSDDQTDNHNDNQQQQPTFASCLSALWHQGHILQQSKVPTFISIKWTRRLKFT